MVVIEFLEIRPTWDLFHYSSPTQYRFQKLNRIIILTFPFLVFNQGCSIMVYSVLVYLSIWQPLWDSIQGEFDNKSP